MVIVWFTFQTIKNTCDAHTCILHICTEAFFVPTVIIGMLHNVTLVIGGASGFGEGTDCGSRFLPAHYEIDEH